jgi:N-acetylmuramoyl-L-alanine amidase
MAVTHIVKQGETLSGIAAQHGFGNFRTIFDHPNNAALKARRDPHVLFPGDRVFIPDRIEKNENRQTGAVHVFATEIRPLLLRLKLLDLDRNPIANAICDVGVETPPPPVKKDAPPPKPETQKIPTDAAGFLERRPIAPRVRHGEVTAHIPPKKKPPPPPNKDTPPPPEPKETTVKFDLKIGSLNPPTKLSGQQARLNNLGYFAGFDLKDLDQLLWAAEEFSCDMLAKPVAKRPRIEPAPPQGEDDPVEDTQTPTGIQDGKIVARIEKEHGI